MDVGQGNAESLRCGEGFPFVSVASNWSAVIRLVRLRVSTPVDCQLSGIDVTNHVVLPPTRAIYHLKARPEPWHARRRPRENGGANVDRFMFRVYHSASHNNGHVKWMDHGFVLSCRVFKIKLSSSQLAAVMNLFDKNNDGAVDCAEFLLKFFLIGFQVQSSLSGYNLVHEEYGLPRRKHSMISCVT